MEERATTTEPTATKEASTTETKTAEAQPVATKEEATAADSNEATTTTTKEEAATADSKEASTTTTEEEAAAADSKEMSAEASADCFTASGIFITPQGPKRADQIVPGDRVMTLTNGFRPVRYIMHRAVHAVGPKAPITFAPGVLNNPVEFECSRKHRLYSGAIPQFKGKNKDHLLCAYELVNDTTVTCREDGRLVDYYHFLLDQHDLVVCSGVISESWVPSKQYMDDTNTTEDIFAAFANRAAALDALEGPWVRETISFDPVNIRRAAQQRG